MGYIDQNGRKPEGVRRLAACLFGPPKTGKTTAACSGRDTLLISFDPEGESTHTITGRDDITVVTPSSLKEINELLRDTSLTQGGKWQWVVVDTLTSMQQMIGHKRINAALAQQSDPRREYMRVGAQVQEVMHDLFTIPSHLVFTAQLRSVADDQIESEVGAFKLAPEVAPSIYKKVLYPSCGVIGRTFKARRGEEQFYYVSFADGSQSPAGSRYDIEALHRDLNMDELLKETQNV